MFGLATHSVNLDQQQALSGSLSEWQNLSLTPDILNQDVYFNKILRQDQLSDLLKM